MRNIIVCFYLLLFFLARLSAQQSKQYSFSHYNTYVGVASNFVNSLTQDEKGYIWLGTPNGLQRYDGHRFQTFKHEAGNDRSLPSDDISLVYADPNVKDLMVATADNKVGIFRQGTRDYEEIPIEWTPPYNLYFRKKFLTTGDGELLLMIMSEGIFAYDPAKRKFLNHSKKLAAPNGWKINDISLDRFTRNLWMACDSGLAVFNNSTGRLNYRDHNPDKDPMIERFQHLRWGLHVLSSREKFMLE